MWLCSHYVATSTGSCTICTGFRPDLLRCSNSSILGTLENRRGHRVGQGVHNGQSSKVLSTSHKPSKKRPAPSKAPTQKTVSTTSSFVQKEGNMNKFSIAFTADGKFSFGKTFGPLALAVACSVTTGGQFHYAHPYASFC